MSVNPGNAALAQRKAEIDEARAKVGGRQSVYQLLIGFASGICISCFASGFCRAILIIFTIDEARANV